MTDTDDIDDAEELLQQSKEQSRHTTEPSSSSSEGGVSRVDAIKTALDDIKDGGAPENINLRDANLKALLVGLDNADELDAVAASLGEEVESDVDAEDVSQSDVARLLMRVGLQSALPDVWEEANQAARQRAMEQAEDEAF
jgi:hypothetical protein